MSTRTELDQFTTAYIECALWSSSAELGECENAHKVQSADDTRVCPECGARVSGYDASFQDRGYSADDLPAETLARMLEDCRQFQERARPILDTLESVDYERAGHDFWLTRNDHGAGFWDGDWPEPAATQLDELSNTFGDCTLYLGDDRRIYA